MYPVSNNWPRSETYVNAVRYMLTGNAAISMADRRHMLIDAALKTIPVAKAYHIPLTTKETDEPKRNTASTDHETGGEEIRSAGQQQVTVDVTSVITEAKELWTSTIRKCYLHSLLSRCSRERIKRKLDNLSQTTTTRTAILWLQYLNKVTIPHRLISKLNGWATVDNTFKQCTTCCHICRIWSHTTCNVCIRIFANDSSSSRNSSRCPSELHGNIPCLRCTETFWAGLSAHLFVEQGPMRNINTY